MQLRYEYDVDTDAVIVRQINARFDYGYEYLGAQVGMCAYSLCVQ